MKRIEFGELRIGEVAKRNLMHVCETHWASGGPKVRELEKEWSRLFDYKRSVAMSSGTDGCINSCFSLYSVEPHFLHTKLRCSHLALWINSKQLRLLGKISEKASKLNSLALIISRVEC